MKRAAVALAAVTVAAVKAVAAVPFMALAAESNVTPATPSGLFSAAHAAGERGPVS